MKALRLLAAVRAGAVGRWSPYRSVSRALPGARDPRVRGVHGQCLLHPQRRVQRPRVGARRATRGAGVSFESDRAYFVLLATAFALCAVGLLALRRGRFGRRLSALRDSQVACTMMGMNTTVTKLQVFALSSAIAAVGGVLLAGAAGAGAGDYTMFSSLPLVLLAVLGGITAVSGALVRGLVLAGLPVLAEEVSGLGRSPSCCQGSSASRSPGDPTGSCSGSAMWAPVVDGHARPRGAPAAGPPRGARVVRPLRRGTSWLWTTHWRSTVPEPLDLDARDSGAGPRAAGRQRAGASRCCTASTSSCLGARWWGCSDRTAPARAPRSASSPVRSAPPRVPSRWRARHHRRRARLAGPGRSVHDPGRARHLPEPHRRREHPHVHPPGRACGGRRTSRTSGSPSCARRRPLLAGHLSGGEQQMLALARALATDPALLLARRAVDGAAPMIVEQLYEQVKAITATGTAILLVEQFAEFVLGVADEVAIMVHGQIRATGRPEEVAGHLTGAYLGDDDRRSGMSEPASDAPGDRIDEFEAELARLRIVRRLPRPSACSSQDSPRCRSACCSSSSATSALGDHRVQLPGPVPHLRRPARPGLDRRRRGPVPAVLLRALHAVLAAAPHLRGAHERRSSEISSSVTDRRRTSREDPACTAARTRARRHAHRAATTMTTAPTPPRSRPPRRSARRREGGRRGRDGVLQRAR